MTEGFVVEITDEDQYKKDVNSSLANELTKAGIVWIDGGEPLQSKIPPRDLGDKKYYLYYSIKDKDLSYESPYKHSPLCCPDEDYTFCPDFETWAKAILDYRANPPAPKRRITLEIECGEDTCSYQPGKFCRHVRTRKFGQSWFCHLWPDELLIDKDGWLQRCDECKEAELEENV